MLIIGSNLTTVFLGVAFFVSVLLRIYRIYGIYQLCLSSGLESWELLFQILFLYHCVSALTLGLQLQVC